MSGYYDEVGFERGGGNRAILLPGETVTVYQDSPPGTQSLSLQSLFSDELLAVPLANPFIADGLGNLVFWADATWVWVKVGTRAARRVRISQVGPTGATGAPGTATAAASTFAALGTPTAGEVRRVTDNIRGLFHATGARWVNSFGSMVNVQEFGALGDGVTDDATAIQAAITAIAAAGGGVVYFPTGIYIMTTGLTVLNDFLSFVGAGANATQLKFTGTGTGITVGDNISQRNGIEFRDLTIRGNQTQPAVGLDLQICWQVNLVGVNFSDFATYHLHAHHGGHLRMGQCQFASNVSTTATFCRLNSQVLSVLNGTTFEGDGGACTFLEITGASKHVAVSGVAGHGDHGTSLTIGGLTQSVSVDGMLVQGMTVAGIVASASGATDVKLSNVVLIALAPPSGAGIELTGTIRASLSDFSVIGWTDQVVRYSVATDIKIHNGYIAGTRPLYDGVGASSGVVSNNSIPGGVPTVTGTGIKLFNNTPWQPQGVATIAVGASPFTYTAGATPEAVYIRAGTVSDISKNSRTLFVASPATVWLAPGEAVVVTYSVAPTMERDRK